MFPPILFHRTPHNATKHGWGEGRIPTKFRKGKKLFKTTLSPLSLCVAHKIEAREKKEYISTSPPCVPVREYRGSAHRAKGLNSIIKGKKSTYKVKKWQGFSDNHTSSSPTHPTRAYEYFHRGKKYPPPRTTSYEDDRNAPNPLSSYDYD